MDDMFDVNDFSKIRYDTGVCLKKVRKDKFRHKIMFEDLDDNLQGEAREIPIEKPDDLDRIRITGVMELSHTIKIFDTFNFKAYIIQKKLSGGESLDMTDYSNGKALVVDEKLMCVLTWLSVLNAGITGVGRKDLITYIMQFHVHGPGITRERIHKILMKLSKISAINKMQHLEELAPNKIKNRGIFYKDDRDYYMEEKLFAFEMSVWEKGGGKKPILPGRSNCDLLDTATKRKVTLAYSLSRLRNAKRNLISEGIEVLKDIDDYTKITDSRIGKITELPRNTVTRNKGFRHKKEIIKLNQDRWIMTEEKTKKFLEFIDIGNGEKVDSIVKRLKINYKTYYEFKEKNKKV